MSDVAVEKKFEARIPMDLWDEYETWLENRGSVSHATLLSRLLRLFLDLQEQTQLRVLFGKELPKLTEESSSSKPLVADAIVSDAERSVQSRRSAQDRQQGKAGR
jgi:hypothetical protein